MAGAHGQRTGAAVGTPHASRLFDRDGLPRPVASCKRGVEGARYREQMNFNTLSGRFAALTILFVVLAEAAILIPSVSNHRRDYLDSRLERAQIASLALLATDESIASDLESELLETAGVYNVVLRRDDIRQACAVNPRCPARSTMTYDLRDPKLRRSRPSTMRLGAADQAARTR